MPTTLAHRCGPPRRTLPPSAAAARRFAHRDDLRRLHHAAGRRDFASQPHSRCRALRSQRAPGPHCNSASCAGGVARFPPRRQLERVPALGRRTGALCRSHGADLRRPGDGMVGPLETGGPAADACCRTANAATGPHVARVRGNRQRSVRASRVPGDRAGRIGTTGAIGRECAGFRCRIARYRRRGTARHARLGSEGVGQALSGICRALRGCSSGLRGSRARGPPSRLSSSARC